MTKASSSTRIFAFASFFLILFAVFYQRKAKMPLIPSSADWFDFHQQFANQISQACDELLDAVMQPAIFANASNSLQANKSATRLFERNIESKYLVSVLNEVQKSTLAVKEWLSISKKITGSIISERLALERVSDEQALRLRNLFEVLVSLIKFTEIGQNYSPYIEHYVAYKTYDALQKNWSSHKNHFNSATFSGKSPIESRLDEIVHKIARIESNSNFNFKNCWYLNSASWQPIQTFLVQSQTYKSATKSFADSASLVNTIFLQPGQSAMEQLERSALKFTYQGIFGAASQEIHFNPSLQTELFLGPTKFAITTSLVDILCATVICRALMLINLAQNSYSQKFFDMMTGPASQNMFSSVVGPPIANIGDLMFASILAEVRIGVVTSAAAHPQTGYVMYQIRPVNAPSFQADILVAATEIMHVMSAQNLPAIAAEVQTNFGPFPMTDPKTIIVLGIGAQNYEAVMKIGERLNAVTPGYLSMRFTIQL